MKTAGYWGFALGTLAYLGLGFLPAYELVASFLVPTSWDSLGTFTEVQIAWISVLLACVAFVPLAMVGLFVRATQLPRRSDLWSAPLAGVGGALAFTSTFILIDGGIRGIRDFLADLFGSPLGFGTVAVLAGLLLGSAFLYWLLRAQGFRGPNQRIEPTAQGPSTM